ILRDCWDNRRFAVFAEASRRNVPKRVTSDSDASRNSEVLISLSAVMVTSLKFLRRLSKKVLSVMIAVVVMVGYDVLMVLLRTESWTEQVRGPYLIAFPPPTPTLALT